jgi:hypothetical protein
MNYRKINDMCQERMPQTLKYFTIFRMINLKLIKPALEAQVMSEAKAQSDSKAECTRST